MSAKKPTPFSLESFEASEPSKKEIEIYTDSRDRIPKPSSVQTPFAAAYPGSSNASGSGALTGSSAHAATLDGVDEPHTVIRYVCLIFSWILHPC